MLTRSRVMWFLGASVVVAGILFQGARLLFYPTSSGQALTSPDGTREFSASNTTSMSFWGRTRHYHEFTLRDVQQNRTVRAWRMEPLPGTPGWGYYGPTVIQWKADSSGVTVPFCEGVSLTFSF